MNLLRFFPANCDVLGPGKFSLDMLTTLPL